MGEDSIQACPDKDGCKILLLSELYTKPYRP